MWICKFASVTLATKLCQWTDCIEPVPGTVWPFSLQLVATEVIFCFNTIIQIKMVRIIAIKSFSLWVRILYVVCCTELPFQSWAFSVLNFSLEMFIVLLTMQSTNFRWRKGGNHTALSPSWFCLAPGWQFKSYFCCFVTISLLHFLHCNSHHQGILIRKYRSDTV